jgi:uncharacterized integral membrane protein (TIGR00697 family)
MLNELIFIFYIAVISSSALIALYISAEALIAYICLLTVLANLFVTKAITLFGLTATASDALAVGASLGLNLLQEYHSRTIAQKTVTISFFCLIVYTISSYLQLAYIPSITDTQQEHFLAILYAMPRITLASLTSYYISQSVDCRLYAFVSKRYTHFLLKNYLCVSVSQALDTIFFSFLALYGILDNIAEIIIVSYSIKLLTLFLAAPFLHITKRLLTR